jgi:hypothetical protein
MFIYDEDNISSLCEFDLHNASPTICFRWGGHFFDVRIRPYNSPTARSLEMRMREAFITILAKCLIAISLLHMSKISKEILAKCE